MNCLKGKRENRVKTGKEVKVRFNRTEFGKIKIEEFVAQEMENRRR
jgi:hypothetical protein